MPLSSGEAHVFSKDRKAEPFKVFPVVLSVMSALRTWREYNKRTVYVLGTQSSPFLSS